MKKIISLIAILTAFACNAQTWPSGAMTAVSAATITTKTTTMTPLSVINIATYAQLTVDTSLVLRATINAQIKAGALLYITVINGGTAATRVVTGSTGIIMASYTMTSAKSHLFTFIYDGTNYLNTGVIKIN